MPLIPGVLPPSKENWELAVKLFAGFPIFTAIQWLTEWYPSGKTSTNSRWNIPGKIGWAVMEVPGFMTLLYIMYSLPKELGIANLPIGNWTMASLYTIHYIYRAILFPWLQPSMSPMSPIVALFAAIFNTTNGIQLGGWLAGYGPTTLDDWSGRLYIIEIGMVVWGWAWLGNIFHDDELREIRREAMRQQKKQLEEEEAKLKAQGKKLDPNKRPNVDKVYMIPKNGLFHYILYPHFLCEWIEWSGFWMIGGLHCTPARSFLINEIATMLPRALQGRRWYIEKFGAERIGGKKAIIPGIL